MQKKILALVLAAAFSFSVAGISFAAKDAKCEVTNVDGNMVTLDCGDQASSMKKGSKVSVKKAKKALEGC